MRDIRDGRRVRHAIPAAIPGSRRWKGGGGSSTQTTQSGPPAQVLQNYENVYGQSQNVASQPYPTYGGGLLAGFTPQQTAGFNNINTAVNSSQPFINAASQDATNATSLLDPSNAIGTIGGYMNPNLQAYLNGTGTTLQGALTTTNNASSGLNAQNFGSTVGNYYSPYAQSVIAPTEAQFNSQNAQQLNQVRGNAAAQGAFGGDREAVAEAQTAGQQQLAEAPVIAGLESQGYNQATTNAMQAAGLQQQTAGLQEQAANTELQTGNTAQNEFATALGGAQGDAWLNSQGSFALGNLGNEAETLGLTGANAQIGAGNLQQQLAQQEDAIPYAQWQAAQGFPYQLTNYEEGMATGTGSLSGTQGSSTTPGPSALSQVAGLGLTGAGIYGTLSNAGAFSGGASDASGALSAADAVAAGDTFVQRGGRILHRAAGGLTPPNIPGQGSGSGIPNTAINIIPTPPPGAGFLGSNTGSTTTGGGPSGSQQAQQVLGDVASIAAIAALAARGGRINDRLGAIRSLRRDITMPRRDVGGAVSPTTNPQAPLASPMQSGLYQQYATLPTEKLQELAVRMPQNPLVQRAVQMRRMQPQTDPSMQQQPQQPQAGLGAGTPGQTAQPQVQPQQMMAAPGGFADGGHVIRRQDAGEIPGVDDYGRPLGLSDIFQPQTVPTSSGPSSPAAPSGNMTADSRVMPGFMPKDYPPPSPVGGAYADFRPAAGFGPQNGIPMSAPHHQIKGLAPAPPSPPSTIAQGTAGGDQPLVSNPPSSGAPEQQPDSGHIDQSVAHKNWLSSPSAALMAAGLGILGGNSPFASVNIGKGGLEGLQFSQTQQQHDENAQLRQMQVQELADYRKQMSQTAQDRVTQYGQTRTDQQQIERDKLALQKQQMENGKFTWQPGTGPDPNDSSKQVPGAWRLPSTGQGAPQFVPTMQLTSKAPNAAAAIPQDVVQMLAQRTMAGDTSALTGLGYGNAGTQARIAVQTEIAKQLQSQGLTGADLAAKTSEYMGERAASRTAGTREANVGMAVNEAKNFMPLALQASANVNRTQFPTINSVLQAYEKGTGDENIVRLAVATNSLTNAYSRAITPSGIPTEGNQQRARDLLDKAWSQGQYSTAVDQLWKEMQAAQASPEQFRKVQSDRISGRDPNAGATAANSSPVAAQSSPQWQHEAVGPNGAHVYSNDGKSWFNQNGQPYQAAP